ncbi:MAG: O-antigen ligase family protein [Alphaproteobacteria bacterium]|nr:O-antigen ligase family protein [Alphaproteobacteria bacterium]
MRFTFYQRFDFKTLLIIFSCLLMPITILARHGATGLLIGMFTIAVCFKLQNKAEFQLIWTPVSKAFFLLGVWACLTCLWSPDRTLSLITSLRFGLISFVGCTILQFVQSFKRNSLDFLQEWLLISFSISLSIIGLALFSKYLLHLEFLTLLFNSRALDHATSLLALIIWPVMYSMIEKNKHFLAVLLLVGSSLAILYQKNHTAAIATLLSLIVWGGSFLSPLRWTRMLKIMILMFMAIAPLLPKTVLAPEIIHLSTKEWQVKSSLTHRLYIWSLMSHRIEDHPFRGSGMEANRSHYNHISRTKKGQLDELNFANFVPHSTFTAEVTGAALHPHNATLQVWMELGIPGIVLAMIIVWFLLREIENIKQQRGQRMALATFVSALTISHSSYGLWQTWWMASLWIITILVCCFTNQINQRNFS